MKKMTLTATLDYQIIRLFYIANATATSSTATQKRIFLSRNKGG